MINPYFAMELLSIINCSIILISILINWKNAELSTKLFSVNIILVILGTLFDALCIGPSIISIDAELALTYASCIIANSLSIAFSYYCAYQTNSKSQVIPLWMPRTITIVDILSISLVTVSYFRGTLFLFVNGEYTAGIPIYIMFIIEFLTTIFMLIILCKSGKQIEKRVFVGLLILICTPIIGGIIELSIPGVYVSYIALSISILIQFSLTQAKLISEAEIRNQIEIEISRTDVMTKLQNRRAYTELLDSHTEPLRCGALFFDVNGLKEINDKKGHLAGDELIIKFANLLRENLPNSELFRISGDEFVALYLSGESINNFEKEKATVREAITNNNSLAAMGSHFEENMNICTTITKAEKDMYNDKREYHIKNGYDRRK